MPKKKSSFYPQSQICGLGTDPVWDDTELVKQFDEALKEWKQERKFTESVSDPEEIPGIGPWVSVDFDPMQLALQTQITPIPFLDDYEMISLYNEALTSWKVERKVKKAGEISIYSSEDTATKVVCSPDELVVQSSWTAVEHKNIDNTATEEKIKSSLTDDYEVIKLFNDALSSWKDTDGIKKPEQQEQQYESENNQSQSNGQQISNGSVNSDTPEKAFKELNIQNGNNEENGVVENTKKEILSKNINENSEIIEQSAN